MSSEITSDFNEILTPTQRQPKYFQSIYDALVTNKFWYISDQEDIFKINSAAAFVVDWAFVSL